MKDIFLRRIFKLNKQIFIENSTILQKFTRNINYSSGKNFIRHSNKSFNILQLNQTKPAQEFTLNQNNENSKNPIRLEDPLISKTDLNYIIKKSEKIENVIDLSKDSKRKEIGFETESVSDTEWKEVRIELGKLANYYSKLSKRNLTALVVATTMMGCVMAPIPFDPSIFLFSTLGTTLTSSSANTFNQFLEVPYDSQMNRTKDRVLVRGNLTPLHAFTFASLAGIAGVSTLYIFVNPITAVLGASNLVLYTLIYTPMKRMSPLNTWMGSVVGAIPPLMGWTAMTGQIDSAGLLLAAFLYSWQFPHFHALSWNLRAEYSRAGYRMIAVLNPRICTSSSLNHTLALTLMCSVLAPMLELTTWNFAIDSLPFNLYFVYLAYMFKTKADAQSSRKLFRYSLLYLPFVILLMFITKYPVENHTTSNDSTSFFKLLETRLESLNNNNSNKKSLNLNKSDEI